MKNNLYSIENFDKMTETDFQKFVYEELKNGQLHDTVIKILDILHNNIKQNNFNDFRKNFELKTRIDDALIELHLNEDARLNIGINANDAAYSVRVFYPNTFNKADHVLRLIDNDLEKPYEDNVIPLIRDSIHAAELNASKWSNGHDAEFKEAVPSDYMYYDAAEFVRSSPSEPYQKQGRDYFGRGLPKGDNTIVPDKAYFDDVIGYRRDGGTDHLKFSDGKWLASPQNKSSVFGNLPPNFEWLEYASLKTGGDTVISADKLKQGVIVKDHKLNSENVVFPTAAILSSPSEEIRKLAKLTTDESRPMLTLTNPLKDSNGSYTALVSFPDGKGYSAKVVSFTEDEFKNTFVNPKPSDYSMTMPLKEIRENRFLQNIDGDKLKVTHINKQSFVLK